MKYGTKFEMLEAMEVKVNANLDIAVSKLQNMKEQELLTVLTDNEWSIAQNIEHLNYYADYYLPEIEKAIQMASSENKDATYSSSWLGSYFVGAMDYRTSKKMNAFKAYVPSTKLDVRRVVSDYISYNEKMLILLRQSRDLKLRSAKVPVSIAKYLKVNLGDIIQVVVFHEERHMEKVKSIMTRL